MTVKKNMMCYCSPNSVLHHICVLAVGTRVDVCFEIKSNGWCGPIIFCAHECVQIPRFQTFNAAHVETSLL